MNAKLLAAVTAVQSISPLGAATIFTLAYVASYVGLAALLTVAAFLIGLHFAKRPIVVDASPSVVAAEIKPSAPQQAAAPEVLPALPSSPIVEAMANGLQIREIKFAQPTNGRAKKVAV